MKHPSRRSSSRSRRWRSTIPKDIYDRVFDLALAIVNATYREDSRQIRARYNELRRYCQEQEALGRQHPFLPETLADFTRSKAKRCGSTIPRFGCPDAGVNSSTPSCSLWVGSTSKRGTGERLDVACSQLVDVLSLAAMLRDQSLLDIDRIKVSRASLHELFVTAYGKGLSEEKFRSILEDLESVRVSMIDDGEQGDFFFIHEQRANKAAPADAAKGPPHG